VTPGDTSGLQCAAIEDDTVFLEQSLNGAMAVYLALEAAVQAGAFCRESQDKLAAWQARLRQLTEAVETHFWNSEERHYEGLGPGSYLLWPARYPVPPERFASHARYLFSEVKSHLNREARVTAYIAKAVLGLAKAGWDSGDPHHDLGWAVEVLLKEVPTPLGHYGEAFLTVDLDGDGSLDFSNRAAIPHLWEASLAYLAAMEHFGASEPAEDFPGDQTIHSCGCTQIQVESGGGHREASAGGHHLNLILLLGPTFFLALFVRRTLRDERPSRGEERRPPACSGIRSLREGGRRRRPGPERLPHAGTLRKRKNNPSQGPGTPGR